ncbi:alpha/beta hydrolase [Streptomyces sp. NPDC003757]
MTDSTNEQRTGTSRRTALRGLGLAVGATALSGGVGASRAAAEPRRGSTTYVLVHGTHSAGAFWMPIARELTLRGHRVVMVDQPRHGTEAFLPESYQRQDLEAMAAEPSPLKGLGLDDYEARVTGVVRRAARNGPVVLVGHSLGGRVGQPRRQRRPAPAPPHLLHGRLLPQPCPAHSGRVHGGTRERRRRQSGRADGGRPGPPRRAAAELPDR